MVWRTAQRKRLANLSEPVKWKDYIKIYDILNMIFVDSNLVDTLISFHCKFNQLCPIYNMDNVQTLQSFAVDHRRPLKGLYSIIYNAECIMEVLTVRFLTRVSIGKIDDVVMKRMCDYLKKNSNSIKSLHLYGNQLDTKTCEIIGSMLKENKILDKLNISKSGIEDNGLLHICRGLKYNKTLKNLNLSQNQITKKE
eukprot:UN34043